MMRNYSIARDVIPIVQDNRDCWILYLGQKNKENILMTGETSYQVRFTALQLKLGDFVLASVIVPLMIRIQVIWT